MPNEFDKRKLNEILDSAGRSGALGGVNAQKLKDALNAGSFDKAMGAMKPGDAEKLQELLSDREAMQRLLSMPQAQQLLKKLLEK